ncbi:NfeD family protein [Pseudanabaena sp. PCC 6802]|uniref:NfeD family protein n=1 Tax=Pseudanabaena sp. PCC 6802 TaxID=118173 RepID=UPI00034C557B|nr:NfeD family protein [Pseudanabaena sp. PCC 6802]
MNLTPSQIWFAIGLALLLLELLVPLPTFLIAGAMGLSAVIVALIALVVPFTIVHVAVWIALAVAFTLVIRRFVPRDSKRLAEAAEGVTLTEIPAGQSGRVQYEGVSWKARCDDVRVAIPADQKVHVLRRQGTTLIVMPEKWLAAHEHEYE